MGLTRIAYHVETGVVWTGFILSRERVRLKRIIVIVENCQCFAFSCGCNDEVVFSDFLCGLKKGRFLGGVQFRYCVVNVVNTYLMACITETFFSMIPRQC